MTKAKLTSEPTLHNSPIQGSCRQTESAFLKEKGNQVDVDEGDAKRQTCVFVYVTPTTPFLKSMYQVTQQQVLLSFQPFLFCQTEPADFLSFHRLELKSVQLSQTHALGTCSHLFSAAMTAAPTHKYFNDSITFFFHSRLARTAQYCK